MVGALTPAATPPQVLAHETLPIAQALLTTAARLRVSLGGDFASCGAERRAVALKGNASAAFEHLTRNARCMVAPVGPGAYVVRARRTVASPAARTVRQPPSPPPLMDAVPEVLVTAQRRPGSLARFPGTLAVFAGDELDDLTRDGVVSLAGELASMETTNLGPGRDKLFLRGLSDGAYTGSTTSTVAHYLDDLPVTLNAPDPDLRLADLERVEVLEGPQGALYGAGSIGGVVRLVTRKPDLQTRGGELTAGISSVSSGGAGSDFEAVFNLPLSSEQLGARAVLYRERTGGYIDDLGLGKRDVNSGRRDGGRASLLWSPAGGWSVSASATFQLLDTAGAQYVTTGAPPLSRTTATPEPYDNDFASLSFGVRGPLPGGQLQLSGAYVHHVSDTTYDATAGGAALAGIAAGPARYDEGRRRDLFFGEALFTAAANGRGHWQLGGFVASTTDRERNALAADDAPSSPYFHEERIDDLLEGAVFADYAYRVTRRVSIDLGVRVFSEDQHVSSAIRQPQISAEVVNFEGIARTRGAAPKLSIEYLVRPDLQTYLNFTSGYRPATLNTTTVINAPFDAPGAPARRVRADVARTWEAGLRFSSRKGWLNAGVFYTDWLDLQSDQFSAMRLPTTVNVGDAVIPGVEVSAQLPWRFGLALSGSLMLDDPRLTQDRNPSFSSRSDAGLPGVSSRAASLGVSARREGPWSTRLSADVHARYVGPSRLGFDASTDGRQGDYVIGDGRIILTRDAWSLELSATNLGDSRADTFAFGNPFLAPPQRVLTPIRPRTLALEVRRRF